MLSAHIETYSLNLQINEKQCWGNNALVHDEQDHALLKYLFPFFWIRFPRPWFLRKKFQFITTENCRLYYIQDTIALQERMLAGVDEIAQAIC